MKEPPKLVLIALASLASSACVDMTPAESCAAICSEMAQCGFTIEGFPLSPGTACEGDCVGLLEARGSACRSSAGYLADCFQTYSCTGNETGCSSNAGSFLEDCS